MNRTRVLASALLAFLFAVGCRKAPPVEPAIPLQRNINGVDVWVDRSPPHQFTVLTTEDATMNLDAAGRKDLNMRPRAGLMEAAARRAKEIGADAAVMVTQGQAPRELNRMTMFVKYEGVTRKAAPATQPATPPTP